MSKSKTSNIQLFQYEGTPVRTVVKDGEVMVCSEGRLRRSRA